MEYISCVDDVDTISVLQHRIAAGAWFSLLCPIAEGRAPHLIWGAPPLLLAVACLSLDGHVNIDPAELSKGELGRDGRKRKTALHLLRDLIVDPPRKEAIRAASSTRWPLQNAMSNIGRGRAESRLHDRNSHGSAGAGGRRVHWRFDA